MSRFEVLTSSLVCLPGATRTFSPSRQVGTRVAPNWSTSGTDCEMAYDYSLSTRHLPFLKAHQCIAKPQISQPSLPIRIKFLYLLDISDVSGVLMRAHGRILLFHQYSQLLDGRFPHDTFSDMRQDLADPIRRHSPFTFDLRSVLRVLSNQSLDSR